MTDLIEGRQSLSDFKGFVACGGFSYGDVLGAGGGWAKTILHNPRLAEMFARVLQPRRQLRARRCNGCQMMSHLRALIPGAQHWPRFERNASEQYEGRLVQVMIPKSPSLFFADMVGSDAPIANAHGEGRAVFDTAQQRRDAVSLCATSIRTERHRNLSVQPERFAGWHHGRHDARWPLHHTMPHRASVPYGADVVAAAATRRRLAMDADVP